MKITVTPHRNFVEVAIEHCGLAYSFDLFDLQSKRAFISELESAAEKIKAHVEAKNAKVLV